ALDDADILEHAQDVVVHDADARQVVERLVALDHRNAMADAPEQDSGEHAGRPVADDHHIVHRPRPGRRLRLAHVPFGKPVQAFRETYAVEQTITCSPVSGKPWAARGTACPTRLTRTSPDAVISCRGTRAARD